MLMSLSLVGLFLKSTETQAQPETIESQQDQAKEFKNNPELVKSIVKAVRRLGATCDTVSDISKEDHTTYKSLEDKIVLNCNDFKYRYFVYERNGKYEVKRDK